MNNKQIAQLIAMAKGLWPGWSSAPQTAGEFEALVAIWSTQLADLENQLVYAAISSLSSDGREFVPPVGMIRQRALEIRARSDGSGIPTAADAYGEVLGAVERVGRYGQPEFSHPVVQATVDAMGWWNLCMSEAPEVTRAHFLKMYAQLAESETRKLTETPVVREIESKLLAIGARDE